MNLNPKSMLYRSQSALSSATKEARQYRQNQGNDSLRAHTGSITLNDHIKKLNQPQGPLHYYDVGPARNLGHVFSSYLASDERTSLKDSLKALKSTHPSLFFYDKAGSAHQSSDYQVEIKAECLPDIPEKTSILHDTDLAVFSDDATGELPINGVTLSEFRELEDLFSDIIDNKTCITIEDDPAIKQFFAKIRRYFKAQACHKDKAGLPHVIPELLSFKQSVIRDLKILLMRPAGREIVKKVVAAGNKLVIAQNDEKNYYKYKVKRRGEQYFLIEIRNQYNLIYSMVSHDAYGHTWMAPSPRFKGLAHEMLHYLHSLERVGGDTENESGSLSSEDSRVLEHERDCMIDEAYSNIEEQYTICGFRKPLTKEEISLLEYALNKGSGKVAFLEKPEHFSVFV